MRELTFDEIQTAAGGQNFQCVCIQASSTTDCSGNNGLIDSIRKCCGNAGSKSAKFYVTWVTSTVPFSGTCTNT